MPGLDSLSRTALIPFWARAQDGLLPTPILGDNAAMSIAPLVKHQFGDLMIGESTRVGCCLRNRLFDEWILDLAIESDRCITMVIDLGVGRDTRLRRQPLLAANYVEVGSEPIIQLRDDWLPNTRAVRISGDGMAVDTWIHTGDRTATPRIVLVLEGMLPYQEPSHVSRFFADAAALLPGAFVLFDSLSSLSSWMANQSVALASGRPPYAWSVWRAPVPIHATGINEAKRRCVLLHVSDTGASKMRTQAELIFARFFVRFTQSIHVHAFPRWMVGREVQAIELEKLRADLRPLVHLEVQGRKGVKASLRSYIN